MEILQLFYLMPLLFCRPTSGCILEALHVDPASGVSIDKDKGTKVLKPSVRYDITQQCICEWTFFINYIWFVVPSALLSIKFCIKICLIFV